MSFNIINKVAYLRTSRDFPKELEDLSLEINKAYIDIANVVNARTIGIFPTNASAITGESWFFNNQRQQSLRQLYNIVIVGGVPQPITHNLNLSLISRFTRCFGEFTDGTNWYGLIHGSNVAIAGQISFYITPANIVFLTGGGQPAITNGQVVLEWLSQI